MGSGSLRYDDLTLTEGTYMPVAYQANDGVYYLNRDFFYTCLVFFWALFFSVLGLWALSLKFFNFVRTSFSNSRLGKR